MGLDIFIRKRKESEIGYFRKVNFLVRFFTDKGFDVQHQTPFKITENHVWELIVRCLRVLDNHELAKELLPTMDGFLFGSTAYDDEYFNDVEEVLVFCEDKLLPAIKKLGEDEHIYFETWY